MNSIPFWWAAATPTGAPGHVPELPLDQLKRLNFLDLNGKDMALDRERTQRLTYDLGQTLDIPVVSGSDTHQAVQYGCIATCFEGTFDTVEEMHQEMLAGGMRSSWPTAQPFRCALPACSNALSRKFTPWAATMWQY